ncbi:hypothetical protein Zmor_012940 [Zophobas morio]|uniref:pseudouridine 5'-phosphatase n=2 Tax=Zophobas morio TaxID=2755281 RepID=A0AA38ICD1_9CUCU|nr:hypothetical protein Zmor_012940 [Zophobas morio]
MRVACPAKQIFQKVTHVIFDLDGLLLDTESIYKKVFSDIAQRHGKVYTAETRGKVIGTTEDVGARIAVEEMQLPMSPEDFLKEYKAAADKSLHTVGLMPGAERLVRHFHTKQIPIAVATSSGQDTYDIKVEHHKSLFSLFSHVVTGGTDPEVKSGKPSPDIFLVCARRFKDSPKPEQCLVLEDAPNGVQAAVKAGMQVVMVPDKQIEEKATKLATLKLNSLEEFRPEMFGLPPLE